MSSRKEGDINFICEKATYQIFSAHPKLGVKSKSMLHLLSRAAFDMVYELYDHPSLFISYAYEILISLYFWYFGDAFSKYHFLFFFSVNVCNSVVPLLLGVTRAIGRFSYQNEYLICKLYLPKSRRPQQAREKAGKTFANFR